MMKGFHSILKAITRWLVNLFGLSNKNKWHPNARSGTYWFQVVRLSNRVHVNIFREVCRDKIGNVGVVRSKQFGNPRALLMDFKMSDLITEHELDKNFGLSLSKSK